MPVSLDIRAEFDRLMEKGEQWPSAFNLAGIGGYLLQHPEIVNRDLCARVISDHEYARKRRLTNAKA